MRDCPTINGGSVISIETEEGDNASVACAVASLLTSVFLAKGLPPFGV
jgi:hypothetical protein